MIRRSVLAVLVLCCAAFAQESAPSSAPQPASDQTQTSSDQQKKEEKEPSKLRKILRRAKPNCATVGGAGGCWDKSEREKEAEEKQRQERGETASRIPKNQPAPRSQTQTPDGESSSRETQVDLSPPPGDDVNHEGAAISDVGEFHAWDPHKAQKNIEVGDFYFHDKNYRAAESRYAEALQWKPNDATATFRLAQAQDKLGKADEALKNYESYLKILPQGEYADDARKSIERLQPKLQGKK